MSIPPTVLFGLLTAALFEAACYLSVGRRDFWTAPRLMASSLVAYLVYSVPAGEFRLESFLMLVAGAAFAVFWLPAFRHPAADLVYLGLVAAVTIATVHKRIFTGPEKIPVAALGQLLWFRLALASYLLHRPTGHIGFGFLPRAREWRTGLLVYLCCMPVLVAAIYALKASEFRLATNFWWRAPAVFVGIFLVVALFEEFFFRGVILPKLRALWGTGPALAVTSVLFGLVHLRFGNRFPNWNMVALSTLAGLFFGWAYLRAGSIRAAMVTHALVVATWRTMFPFP